MKLKRNGIAVTALVLSAAVFMTTALADTFIGSGYDSLKNSVKNTAAQVESGMDSLTFEAMCVMKDNGNKLIDYSETVKVDNKNKAMERTESGITSYYSYSDKDVRITKDGQNDTYFVNETNGKFDNYVMPNPFKEKHYSDMEKIFDAAVGGLKDSVQVEENADGGKVYTGSITQTQVPTLINAIASFGLKQVVMNNSSDEKVEFPQIKSDIFIKNVSGKAIENEKGYINYMVGDVAFSGNDEKGVSHEISIEILFNLKDINATQIQKPNLEGKKVEKIASGSNYINSKYIGTYKNNIVIEDNNQLIKIGERTLTITKADDQTIAGTYSESYKDGYESYAKAPLNFKFEYPQDSQAQFSYVNNDGETEYGRLSPSSPGKVYLSIGEPQMEVSKDGNSSVVKGPKKHRENFDGEFNRVFEN